jgi:hypothetical protein
MPSATHCTLRLETQFLFRRRLYKAILGELDENGSLNRFLDQEIIMTVRLVPGNSPSVLISIAFDS